MLARYILFVHFLRQQTSIAKPVRKLTTSNAIAMLSENVQISSIMAMIMQNQQHATSRIGIITARMEPMTYDSFLFILLCPTSRIRRGYLPSLESGLLDDSTENTGCHEVRMGITLTSDTSTRSSEPSEFITQISGRFRRCVSKRIFFPSGDQVGLSLEAGAGSSVNCFWLLPSGFMIQT